MGASIYFKLNSHYILSSSTFGIMLGGLMNGMENERRIYNFAFARTLLLFAVGKLKSIAGNFSQSLFSHGNV